MSKRTLLTPILCFLFVFLCASTLAEEVLHTESASPDFKRFYWGDSKETIMQLEGKPFTEGKMNGLNATYIVYETQAVGLDMLLGYYFCDEGLFQIRYVLQEEHSNESLYINDYETFKEALTKKYGTPLIDSEKWANDSKKKYYADNKGDALCYGYLTYQTYYMSDRTIIGMDMSADNFDVSMTVDYQSLTISPGEADYSDEI